MSAAVLITLAVVLLLMIMSICACGAYYYIAKMQSVAPTDSPTDSPIIVKSFEDFLDKYYSRHERQKDEYYSLSEGDKLYAVNQLKDIVSMSPLKMTSECIDFQRVNSDDGIFSRIFMCIVADPSVTKDQLASSYMFMMTNKVMGESRPHATNDVIYNKNSRMVTIKIIAARDFGLSIKCEGSNTCPKGYICSVSRKICFEPPKAPSCTGDDKCNYSYTFDDELVKVRTYDSDEVHVKGKCVNSVCKTTCGANDGARRYEECKDGVFQVKDGIINDASNVPDIMMTVDEFKEECYSIGKLKFEGFGMSGRVINCDLCSTVKLQYQFGLNNNV